MDIFIVRLFRESLIRQIRECNIELTVFYQKIIVLLI